MPLRQMGVAPRRGNLPLLVSSLVDASLDVDKYALALAERLVGTAFYDRSDYANAAYHLARAQAGVEVDARATRLPLYMSYYFGGAWDLAADVGWAILRDGRTAGGHWEAIGHWAVGRIKAARGQVIDAREHFDRAYVLFKEAGDERSAAVTMGRIADILQARGQLDEALRIRKEEELLTACAWATTTASWERRWRKRAIHRSGSTPRTTDNAEWWRRRDRSRHASSADALTALA